MLIYILEYRLGAIVCSCFVWVALAVRASLEMMVSVLYAIYDPKSANCLSDLGAFFGPYLARRICSRPGKQKWATSDARPAS